MARFQQDPKVIIYDIDEFLQNMPTDKIQEISFTQKDLHKPGEVSTTEILIRILVVKEFTDPGFTNTLVDSPEMAAELTYETLKDAYKQLGYGSFPSPSPGQAPNSVQGQKYDQIIIDDLGPIKN